jgi:RimJ/RimL family protein N-acetyltransferase
MILGERVRLRAIERDDLPRFVAWLNDPEVRQGLLLAIPLSLPQEEQWYNHILEKPMEEQPLVIEVNTPESWTAVGNIALDTVDWKERSAEVGIFIGEKSLWSRGYGREALRLIQRHGFNTLNLNRIFLRVYATNPRAVKSYEYAGFVLEGRLRQAHFQDGQYVDVLIMSVLRSEWQA